MLKEAPFTGSVVNSFFELDLPGSPKALDEDETELLDKLEMVSKTQ